MKKVLVTGCSGYIGSHLVDLLKLNGYEVHGMDRNMPQSDSVEVFYHADITCNLDILDEYDCVVHLAALVRVGESEKYPMKYYATNVAGTANVLGKIKTKNFIFSSTGAAVDCLSAYGKSKRVAEGLVQDFAKLFTPIDYTIFRFYNVIGSSGYAPTNPDGLLYKLNEARKTGKFVVHGTDYSTKDGSCIRDYIHVDEVCNGILTAIEKPANSIESLGHGVGYSVLEMVDIFKKVNNCDFQVEGGPRRKGDIESYVLKDVSPYMMSLYPIEELLRLS